jgi:hypothetical protein
MDCNARKTNKHSLLEFADRIKAVITLSLVLNDILNVVIKFFISFFLFSVFDPFQLLIVNIELIFALCHTQAQHTR